MNKTLSSLMILALTAAPSVSLAQGTAQPAAQPQGVPVMTLFVVTKDAEGKEVLTPAGKSLRPGALIERRLTASVARATRKARMVTPVDPAYVYQKGSDALSISGRALSAAELAPRVTYSLNVKPAGPQDFSLNPMKTVEMTENGAKVRKQVPAEVQDYRAVAYDIGDLKAGDTVTIKQRVRLK